jgi:hypothetical protein
MFDEDEPVTLDEAEEAYVQGLIVSICAVTAAHRDLAMQLAEQIESYLPPLSVEVCRVEAMARIAMSPQGDES